MEQKRVFELPSGEWMVKFYNANGDIIHKAVFATEALASEYTIGEKGSTEPENVVITKPKTKKK